MLLEQIIRTKSYTQETFPDGSYVRKYLSGDLRGYEYWYDKDGKLHRVDGPAVTLAEYWYDKDGKLHRVDGPAVTYPNGKQEWWLNGNRVTKVVKERI